MAAQMETEHNDDEVRRERAVMTIQGRSPPSSRGGIIRQWLQPSAMRMEDENTDMHYVGRSGALPPCHSHRLVSWGAISWESWELKVGKKYKRER